MKMKIIAFLSAWLTALALAAADYDERLEFVESTGTQWIDTGVKPNWRRTVMHLDFRVVGAPTVDVGKGVSIAGVTGTKDDATGWDSKGRKSLVMGLGHKTSGKYQLWPYFAGGLGGGYRIPDDETGTADFQKTWNVRADWRLNTSTSFYGTNMYMVANGSAKGGFYHDYADAESAYSFYIGAANNAGEGLVTAEGSLAKVQWHGVRLYTDGALVGDFIPVKKDGVAGFYDNVSKKFFASQGADAWVAPTTVTWTGSGAAGSLTDAANWGGGAAPSGSRAVAVIPDGTELSGTVETVAAAFNGLGGVRLAGANAKLHLNGISASTSLYFPVAGTGVYRLESTTSSTTSIKLYQSLCNFYGTTQVSNAYVNVYQPMALGLQGRSTADVYLGGGSQRLTFPVGGSFADIAFRKSGQFGFFENSDCRDYTAWSFPANSVGFHGNGVAYWYLCGPFTGRTDAQNTFNPYSMKRCTLTGEAKNLNLTQLDANCDVVIDAPVHSTARAKDSAGAGQAQANIRVNAGKNLSFSYANALDENSFVQVGYATNPTAQPSNVIDLGGTDQRVGTLGVWASSFDGATDYNPNLVLKSDAPATLTICGQLRTAAETKCQHVFPGLVSGAASVALDSRASVMAEAWSWTDASAPGGIRFNCPNSDTTGVLSSSRGTLEVMATATFPNLSGVVASGTGVVKLSTAAVGNANTAFTVAIKDTTARLELAEGVTLVCNTCELPGGAFLSPGSYSATATGDAAACAYLSGAGVLEVKSALWTGWPTAGTATRVEIPTGTAVTIADEDIANVEALEEIVCNEGVTITIKTTEALNVKAKISGPVAVKATGAGAITLSGDNSGISGAGHFELTDLKGTLTVANFSGLGGADTAAAVLTQTSGAFDWLAFTAQDGVFTNSVPLKIVHGGGSGNMLKTGSASADETLVFANDVEISASGENWWSVRNHVQFVSGAFAMNGHVRLTNGTSPATLDFLGDATAELGKNGGQAIIYFEGVTFGGASVWAANGLSPDAARNVKFAKANCLGANCVLASYVNGSGTHFDFCGYDQEIGRLRHPATGSSYCPQLTSAEPATLKAVGTTSATETVRYLFTGALSYWHDTVQDLTMESKSTSTGALTVSKGSVTFATGAGWSGAAVTVKSGGSLVCNSTDSLASGEHELAVEKGGALTVASGVTLKVKTATLGDVVLDSSRVYTVEEINQLGPGVTLAGEGSIQTGAKSISGDWAGWPEVGTAETANVPDGLTVEVTDADLAKVAALKTVACGAGTKIVFKTTARELTLATKFVGGATIEFATDGATVILTGDNSELVSPGGFFFSNTTVIVRSRHGLGSARTAAATFWPAQPFASNRSRLFFEGAETVTNECPLVFNYAATFGHCGPDVRFVQAGDVDQEYGTTEYARRLSITNDLTIAAGHRLDVGGGGLQSLNNAMFRIEDGATFAAQGNYGTGSYFIAGDCTGRFAVEQVMTSFVFGRANCLGISELRYYDASYGAFFVDLNGYDQTVPGIVGEAYTNAHQQILVVKSETPATLTLSGATSGEFGEAVQFLGKVSVVKNGASTQAVGFATSTTEGTLTVNGGAFAFEHGAKWTGGDVTVNDGASLVVKADAIDGVFGTGRKGTPSLFLNGTGKLSLPDASETALRVYAVTRDGVMLQRGDYTASNCDWVVGEGTVHVAHGAPRGLIMIVR